MPPAGPGALRLLPPLLLLLGPAPRPASSGAPGAGAVRPGPGSAQPPARLTALPPAGSDAQSCLLPRDAGPCRDALTRYYYDRLRQACLPFRFGGCGGNANRFASREACDDACWAIEEVPKICRFEVNQERCGKSSKEYFFDLKSMRCKKFLSGGCRYSMNRFPNEASCMDFCASKKMPSYCYSPKDEGFCSANETRYYFNMRHKACEPFTYTGCGGNDNNFSYLNDCQRVCEKAYRKGRRKTKVPPFAIERPKNWRKAKRGGSHRNPSPGKAEAGGLLSSRLAWAT